MCPKLFLTATLRGRLHCFYFTGRISSSKGKLNNSCKFAQPEVQHQQLTQACLILTMLPFGLNSKTLQSLLAGKLCEVTLC